MTKFKEEIVKSLKATFGEDVKDVEFLDDHSFKVSFSTGTVAKNPVHVMESLDAAIQPVDLKDFSIEEINGEGAIVTFTLKDDEGKEIEPAEIPEEPEVVPPSEETPSPEAEEIPAPEANEEVQITGNDKVTVIANPDEIKETPAKPEEPANEAVTDNVGSLSAENTATAEELLKGHFETAIKDGTFVIKGTGLFLADGMGEDSKYKIYTGLSSDLVSLDEAKVVGFANDETLVDKVKSILEKGAKLWAHEVEKEIEANEDIDPVSVQITNVFKDAGLLKDEAEISDEVKAKLEAILNTPVATEGIVNPVIEETAEPTEVVVSAIAEEVEANESIADLQAKLVTDGKLGMLNDQKVIYIECNESIFFFDGKETHFSEVKPEEVIECNESCEFFHYLVTFANAVGELASPFLTLTPFDASANKYSLKTAYEMDPGVISQLLKVLTPVEFTILPIE